MTTVKQPRDRPLRWTIMCTAAVLAATSQATGDTTARWREWERDYPTKLSAARQLRCSNTLLLSAQSVEGSRPDVEGSRPDVEGSRPGVDEVAANDPVRRQRTRIDVDLDSMRGDNGKMERIVGCSCLNCECHTTPS